MSQCGFMPLLMHACVTADCATHLHLIKTAAEMLNVGVTTLKKRVRDLGIVRWPYRRMCKILGLQAKRESFIAMMGQEEYDRIVDPAIKAALVCNCYCLALLPDLLSSSGAFLPIYKKSAAA